MLKKLIIICVLSLFVATPLMAADTKLSALTALEVAPAGTDQLYINDGGVSKRITIDYLFDYIEGAILTITGNWINTDNPWAANELISTVIHEGESGASLTALDGENITDNTIDDDSIDFGDVTCVDLTTTDCGVITSTGKISTVVTTEQMRLGYDATNYLTVTLADDGHTTIATVDPDGAEADINFTPDGNVGVKTAAPASTLDVTGTFAVSGNATVGGTLGVTGATTMTTVSAGAGGMTVDADGDTAVKTITATPVDDAYMTLDQATASDTDWTMGVNGDSGGDDNDDLEFRKSATPGTSVMAHLEPDTGNYILGTAAPDEATPEFHITADADSDAADTTETISISLTQAADPTAAYWALASTQTTRLLLNGMYLDAGAGYVETTTDVDVTIGAGVNSMIYVNNHASAIDYNLPAEPESAAGVSKIFCFKNRVAQVISIVSAAGDEFEWEGTDTSGGAQTAASTGAVGEFVCLQGIDDGGTDFWLSWGVNGTWGIE